MRDDPTAPAPNPLPDLAGDDPLFHDPEGGMARLVAIMSRLRDPARGCPWDLEQDFASIAPYTIEEAYEVAEAVAADDMAALRDELGDLLFQSVYHARLAEERGAFVFDDVARAISDKMIRRHPHVFGAESREKSAEQQTRDWERIKAAERAGKPEASSALDGVAVNLPALTRAVKLQNRAARVGFDWPDPEAVLQKLDEEVRELRAELAAADTARLADEVGDLLFVLANLARKLELDPEACLQQASDKFTRRFERVEAILAVSGTAPDDADLDTMEQAWSQAKREGL